MTTPITDITYTLAGLTLGGVDANGVQWIVSGTSGWYDGPGVRLNQVVIPRYDGAYRANNYRAVRTIVITGYANAPNKPVAQAARDQFQGLYAIGGAGTLTVVDGTQTRTMTVELGDSPKAAPHMGGTGFDWQITLSAADPRKYGRAQSSPTGLPAVSSTGLVWGTPPGAGAGLNWQTPPGAGAGLTWGNYSGTGLVTVTNPGTADVWPVFAIAGPVTTPSITDGTGNLLAWTGAPLLGTDLLVITSSPFGPRSVLLNGQDNRASLTTAQWAAIPAGGSQSYQFGGSSAGSPTLTVTVAPAYW